MNPRYIAADALPPHSLESEVEVLGGIAYLAATDPEIVAEAVSMLDAGDFYRDTHQALYRILRGMLRAGRTIDAVTAWEEIQRRGEESAVGGYDGYCEIMERSRFFWNLMPHARIVKRHSQLRQVIELGNEMVRRAYARMDEPEAIRQDAAARILDMSRGETRADLVPFADAARQALERIRDRMEGRTDAISTGLRDIDEILGGGLRPGQLVIVAGRPAMGKAQPLDAKILTLSGWTTMGEIRVGDAVASVDGSPSFVTEVFPQGRRQVYLVTFADGRSTECCDEHLWTIHYRGWDRPRTMPLREIRALLDRKRYRGRIWIDQFSGEFGSHDDLLMDPWMLGYLLGNGCLRGSTPLVSSASTECIAAIANLAGEGMTLREQAIGACGYRISRTEGRKEIGPNPVRLSLELLGIYRLGAHEKFIPDCYKAADRDSRWRLLAGLMDSDGWIEKTGSLVYSTTSRRLADDFVDLVRSLGGTASWTTKTPTYTYEGEKKQGRLSYTCCWQHPEAADRLGLVSAKRLRLSRSECRRRLNLVSIEPTRVAETQCIRVSHSSQLYVTDDYIVTHNSALSTNISEYQAIEEGRKVLYLTLEMSPMDVAERIMVSRSGVAGHKVRTGKGITDWEFGRLERQAESACDITFLAGNGLTVPQIEALATRERTAGRLDLLVIDYLGLMATDAGRNASRNEALGRITNRLKQMALSLNIPVLLVVQLNRKAESRSDNRPFLSDLRDCLAGNALITNADTGERVPVWRVACTGMRFNVWSLDKGMRLVKKPIVAAWQTGQKEVFRVTTRTGRVLRCTEGHRLLTLDGWRELRTLGVGDSVGLPRRYAAPETGGSVSEDQALLLGWLIGDGYLGGSPALTVSSDREADFACLLAGRAFDIAPTVKPEHPRTSAKRVVMTTGRACGAGKNPLTAWLRSLGIWECRGASKFAPDAIFSQSDAVVAAFLRGLFHADGSFSYRRGVSSGTVKLSTISERLARDVQHLLLRFGIISIVRPENHARGGFRTAFALIWTVRISDHAAVAEFMARVGFLCDKQERATAGMPPAKGNDAGHTDRLPLGVNRHVVAVREELGLSHQQAGWREQGKRMSRATACMLAERLDNTWLATLGRSDVTWDEVESIESIGMEPTYDITVGDLHNFCVDGFITHNSGEIEQDADIVLLIHRPEYYTPGEKPGIAEVIVAKQRNGQVGSIELQWQKELTRFRDLARQDEDEIDWTRN